MNRVAMLGLAGFALGLAAGYLLGFGVGQSTRSRLSESIKTSFSGGTFTLQVPMKEAAVGGIVDYFSK